MFANDDGSMNIGANLAVNTAVIQMEASVDELIKATGKTAKEVNKELENKGTEAGAYLFIHCGGRRLAIGERIDEVAELLKKEAHGVPFIAAFTFGEYGVKDHGANTTGGLMLSFTGFSKWREGEKPQKREEFSYENQLKIESEISRINQTDFDITKSYSLKKEGTTVKNLIGYEWKDASNGATIEVVNPATQELIDTVPNVTEQDVEEAAKVAEIEQKKWAKTSIYERAEKLYKFVDLVEENKERLAILLSNETGKPIKEARGEIANVRIGVRGFIEKAKHNMIQVFQ